MDWLAEAAARRPEAPAVVTSGRTVSYRELDRAASGVASIVVGSASFGRRPVALWGERTVEAIAACWGIPRAGAVAVLVDSRFPPATAMDLTRRAGAGGLWTAPDGGLDRLIEHGGSGEAWGPPHEQARFVLFTSGSEGTHKGVVLPGAAVEASVLASRARLGSGADDPWLAVLPLHHVGGLSIVWRQAQAGAPVVLHEHFDAASAADALGSVRFASLVPVMLRRILDVDDRTWSGLEAVLVGGAGAAQSLLVEARRRGIPAVPTYGMTETCSQIATPDPAAGIDGTVGRALEGAEIRVTQSGRSVIGAEGRIEIRGSMLSSGYLDGALPGEDGWFVTGDVGILDDGGNLQVVGRADQVIVTGGENVHPMLVERALTANPAIRAVRVFGQPDDEWGMRIGVEVVTSESIAELEAWAKRHLSPSMRPRQWNVVDRIGEKLGG